MHGAYIPLPDYIVSIRTLFSYVIDTGLLLFDFLFCPFSDVFEFIFHTYPFLDNDVFREVVNQFLSISGLESQPLIAVCFGSFVFIYIIVYIVKIVLDIIV